MAGTGGGAGPDAVDAQLLPQLPDEIQALGRVHLADRALCHQLTPLLVCPLVFRLSASRGGPLVGSIGPAPARTATPPIPGLARTGGTGGGTLGAAYPRLRLDQRGRDVAPVALGQQVPHVQLGQGGRALATEGAPGSLVFRCYEGQGTALDAHAGRSADAMGEPLRRIREVVVDHQVDVADVETTGGDVCGDQHVGPESAEGIHGAVPDVLREVTLQIGAVMAEVAQIATQLANAVLGAAEDDRGAAVTLQQLAERAQLFRSRDPQEPVLQGLLGRRGDDDADRVVEV